MVFVEKIEAEYMSEHDYQKPLTCALGAIDKKAENIKIFDLTGRSSLTDYFVLCSAVTDRQVKAIADSVKAKMKAEKNELVSVEGYQEGRWILMDFGDVIVHIFQDALREYYDLDAIWRDAPRVTIPTHFYGRSESL